MYQVLVWVWGMQQWTERKGLDETDVQGSKRWVNKKIKQEVRTVKKTRLCVLVQPLEWSPLCLGLKGKQEEPNKIFEKDLLGSKKRKYKSPEVRLGFQNKTESQCAGAWCVKNSVRGAAREEILSLISWDLGTRVRILVFTVQWEPSVSNSEETWCDVRFRKMIFVCSQEDLYRGLTWKQ